MSGRGFSYSKHGLLSANLIIKEESVYLSFETFPSSISRMAVIPEEITVTGPSMMDKALVGVVWTLALVYSLLTQQILSKEVDIPCSVRCRAHM